MYWKAIGTSVRAVYEHTYLYNRLWGHADLPARPDLHGAGPQARSLRFRRFADSYGGAAPSWWDWQETNRRLGALGAELVGARPRLPADRHQPGAQARQPRRPRRLGTGAPARAAGRLNLPITGIFGKLTTAAVRTFQAEKALPADGVIGQTTWNELLAIEPVRPLWAGRQAKRAARRGGQQRGDPPPPALGLAAGQGLRDRSWLRSLSGPEIIPGRAPAAHPSGA